MDVAARMLVAGHNPYPESLLDGYRLQELPLRFATPLTDGGISDRLAYPALSFLLLVPAVLLRVPTHLVYAACFVAALALVVWRTPWWLRGVVLVLFLYDEAFLAFVYGGVIDSPWMLGLVGRSSRGSAGRCRSCWWASPARTSSIRGSWCRSCWCCSGGKRARRPGAGAPRDFS